MKPKDEARQWLDTRCGRDVTVETHVVNASVTPVMNKGPLTKGRLRNPEIADALDDSAPVENLYQVGEVSYNLADLPDDIEVQVRSEPAEQLELVFDDGTAMLIRVTITAI